MRRDRGLSEEFLKKSKWQSASARKHKKVFSILFFERADEMAYRFKHSSGKDDSIFNLLSDNCLNTFSQKQ